MSFFRTGFRQAIGGSASVVAALICYYGLQSESRVVRLDAGPAQTELSLPTGKSHSLKRSGSSYLPFKHRDLARDFCSFVDASPSGKSILSEEIISGYLVKIFFSFSCGGLGQAGIVGS